jgi:hypothetical protein
MYWGLGCEGKISERFSLWVPIASLTTKKSLSLFVDFACKEEDK